MRLRTAGRSHRFPYLTASLSAAGNIIVVETTANQPLLVRRLTSGAVSNVLPSQLNTAWSLVGGSPTGGTPIDGIPMDGVAGAPGYTVKVGVEGDTYDGSLDIDTEPWYSLAGYKFAPLDAGEWIYLPAGVGNLWAFRIKNTPAQASTYAGELEAMELIP